MKKYIVTISREFGCNAREIGRSLASRLDAEFYDKCLVDLAAEKAGINRDLFNSGDEFVECNKKGLLQLFGYGSTATFYDETAIAAQAEVIRELANQEKSGIFFGRCSDYILREYPDCINIFLYAPLEFKIRHMEEVYHLDENSTEKLIRRVDKQRHNYYKYVTGKNRGDRDYKHVMLDVSRFGTEKVLDIICEILKAPENGAGAKTKA